jgi:hypothetical protein
LPSDSDCAFALRLDVETFHETFSALHDAGLFDKEVGRDGHTEPHNWKKRQYKSDSSTERVKRYRKRSATVTETPPDTDTEEERKLPSVAKETAPIGGNQLVEITASLKAKPQTKGNGDGRKRRQQVPLGWWPSADGVDYARERSVPDSEVEQFRNYHIAKGTLFADIEAGWRTWANNHVKFAAQRLSNRPRSGGIVAGTLEDIAAIESEI